MSLAHRIKTALKKPFYYPPIKRVLQRIPVLKNIYPGWWRIHPIDMLYGIDTSGYVPREEIHSDRTLTALINPYAGSQPGVVRTALSVLPELSDYTLVDIGCGKGRMAIVGSEFPFHSILGVELSRDLAQIARDNAEKIKQRFPERPLVHVKEGNAVEAELPQGKLVLFMYHTFGELLMAQMVAKLEALLAAGAPHIMVVYYNPVFGALLDESSGFTRWYARTIAHTPREMGYGPDKDDTVVIWQSVRGALPSPHASADRPIVITTPLWRADLAA